MTAVSPADVLEIAREKVLGRGEGLDHAETLAVLQLDDDRIDELLALAHRAERAAHRERLVRWGARTLDVDVITYGDWRSEDPELTVPHPRAHERAFVLAPWHAADPQARLPGHGPVAELLARAADRADLRPGPALEGFDRGPAGEGAQTP